MPHIFEKCQQVNTEILTFSTRARFLQVGDPFMFLNTEKLKFHTISNEAI